MDGVVTAERYAAFAHVATPHGERIGQALDAGLGALGLLRNVTAVVPGFPAALAVACASDLVALLPASFMLAHQRPGSAPAAASAHAFELPVPVEAFSISFMWHPRAEADPAQRWLRELIVAICRERMPL